MKQTHTQLDTKQTKWSILKETHRVVSKPSKQMWLKGSVVTGFENNHFLHCKKQNKTNLMFRAKEQGSLMVE